MANKSLDSAIHDKLWLLSTELVGVGNVYDDRPMSEVAYPFIDFQTFQMGLNGTKNGTTASMSIVLNVWDTADNRKKVSEVASDLIQKLTAEREMFGYPVSLNVSASGMEVVKDTTVTPFIWRGLVRLEFII
jgi:hypothetical protein